MITTDIALLLLPVAAFSGWCASRFRQTKRLITQKATVPYDYLVGFNFLLNEQPDKAVDVFIKMLEVDSQTVETHLALGGLFRRRGEIERATRIHQNLIARPNLSRQLHMQALLALGQDYFAAGVFDRAERIFQEAVASGEQLAVGLRYLLDVYQLEKNWGRAIDIAQQLALETGEAMAAPIAHYHCELAMGHMSLGDDDQAMRVLRKALSVDKSCARASLLAGELEIRSGRYKPAIRYLKQVVQQDPDYLIEALPPLEQTMNALDRKEAFMTYLNDCLAQYPRISTALLLTDKILQTQGIEAATVFIVAQLRQRPSIRGLYRLIQLHLQRADHNAKPSLQILAYLTANFLENKPFYRCGVCGFSAKTLHWFCPSCRSWSTVKPIQGLEGD